MKEIEYKLHYVDYENLKIEGVYLIRNTESDKLKIGITNNLMRRLSEIQKSFQFCGVIPELKIECFIEYKHNLELEQYLHNQLKEYNYQNEWFSINDINIVLDKLNEFKHKEPIKKYVSIIDKSKIVEKPKSQYEINYYKYYKYEFKNNEINCIVFFKRNKTTFGILEDISKIVSDMGHTWNAYSLHEELIEEINLGIENLNNIFLKFNTDTLALINDEYMRLDVYLGNIFIERKIKSLKDNKEIIITLINDIINTKYNKTNAETIVSDIEKIEEKCIKIQEYLNESIELHHRMNFKPFGLA